MQLSKILFCRPACLGEISLVALLLFACGGSSPIQQEVYDYRDEKYQDFYSRLARGIERQNINAVIEKNSFSQSFDKAYINEVLGLELKDDIFFRLVISRVNPSENNTSSFNFLFEKKEVFDFYFKDKEYKECPINNQIDGLFCIDYLHYFYIEKYTENKLEYVNQTLNFQCSEFKLGSCRLFSYGSNPYDIKVAIHFSKPQDFFRIISYVEKYIYNATGEHIWQHSFNGNKST